MNKEFSKIFWGLLMVFFELHILIDLLPDPIGYYLIFSGITSLVLNYREEKKSKYIAFVLIFLSIPSVFISQNTANDQYLMNTWTYYFEFVGIVKLILVFYLFQLIQLIVKEKGDLAVQQHTRTVFISYMTIMIILTSMSPFMLNVTQGIVGIFVVIAAISALILEIILLVFIRKVGKLPKI